MAATVSGVAPQLALLCFILFQIYASSWSPETGREGFVLGILANVGWTLCFAALILGLGALLVGTDHRGVAVFGVILSIPVLILGYLLLLPAAL